MTRPDRAGLLVAFLVTSGVLLGPAVLSQDVFAATLLAGTAKLELIPPAKAPLAGYSRRSGKPSTGVHDPLFVRALVLGDGQTSVALASCDLLIIDERLFEAVQQQLDLAQPNLARNLLIASTHTHSGPGAYGKKFLEKLSMGHFNPDVFEWLSAQITQAILTASTNMRPVTVSYATTQTSGFVVNRMSAEGAVDPELVVLAFYDAHSTLVAAVVNFSAHATTLGSWNRRFSADYPGVLAQAVEQRYSGSTCLFFAGAVGDQAPVKQGDGFERAQWFGSELAHHVFTGLASSSDHGAPLVRIDQRTMRLPPARLRLGTWRLPSWISRAFVDDDATLTLIGLGRVLVLGVPCDLSAALGLELKAHARTLGYAPVLVGFANDYIGYCLPQRLYWTDSYEARLAFNGPTTGPLLMGELKQMMDELAGPQ